ncbi:MAG: BamA/TamA family outer membrane protein [Candidatus Sericytochromatia bacterium]|nr:BamA/TamA family outer membrane protein [Candidatus Sericytochromatia bacterium]
MKTFAATRPAALLLALDLTLAGPEALAQPLPSAAEPEILRLDEADRFFASRIWIEAVRFEGSQQEDLAWLVTQIRTGDRVDAQAIAADQQRLIATGAFARVDTRLEPARSPGQRVLVFVLQDNPVLKQIQLSTPVSVFTTESILAPFEALTGERLDFERLASLRQELEARYQRAGYPVARVDLRAEPDGSLLLAVYEGRLAAWRFDSDTPLITQAEVIQRELRLQPGDLVRSEILEADLNVLRRLGFFEQVLWRAEPAPEDPGQVVLVLQLRETPTRDIGLDGSFSNRDGLLGGAHYTDPNFLGRGQLLNLQFQAGLDLFNLLGDQRNQAQRALFGRLEFYDPWLFAERTGLGVALFADRIPLFFGLAESFDQLPLQDLDLSQGLLQNRTGLQLRLTKPLALSPEDLRSTPWQGQLSFGAEQVQLVNFAGTPQRSVTAARRFSATDVLFQLQGRLSHDSRDHLLEPGSGWLSHLTLQPFWGDTAYLRLSGQLAHYWSPWPEVDLAPTLAWNLQGGSLMGAPPLYEQFYGTGFAALRGWPENGLLFGQHYWLSSLELRQPIWGPVSAVFFGDLGQFLPERLPEAHALQSPLGGLKYGLGFGLRIQSPLGLIRLDYGLRDLPGWGFARAFELGQLHFGIGHKF